MTANASASRCGIRSSGRTSTTTPDPFERRAKKSGACRRRRPSYQDNQNGWEATATTAGSKSISITWSRSSQDSYPTCSPDAANHHQPAKLDIPLANRNERTAGARSNRTPVQASSGSRLATPSAPT